MKFGVFVPQGWRMDLVDIADPEQKYEAMTRVAREAESHSFDSIWLYDHFHTVPNPELETNFECWMTTAALARDTTTIRIGQMVTCNSYRPPALLAKMASTVDVLSHGRLDFGIGAGWYEHEYNAYGYPYPDGPERLRMLREALQVIRAMWTDEYATFEGKYYHLDGAINEPKGVQKPHPPIWIGGSGEKVTLKLVAQYGDACNTGSMDLNVFRHKLDVLKGHCDTVGRDYDTIIKSTNVNVMLLEPGQDPEKTTEPFRNGTALAEWRKGSVVGTSSEVVPRIRSIIDAGADYIIFYLYDVVHLEVLHHFTEEVLPALK
jgi:F420-dependent oxidoreductase-like protein